MEFNLARLHEAIAETIPDRECIVFRDRRLTYRDLNERSRRLANALISRGLGVVRQRSELSNWESGQDHVALYLLNGNEYLEGMLGAFKARTVPINVNYRYVDEELIYLLRNSRARAIVYHSAFAPLLERVRPHVPDLEVLLQVEDESGNPLLEGAAEYEAALRAASPERPDVEWSPDDLYALYTGGTTGMPKGVLWRQHDIYVAALGGRRLDTQQAFDSIQGVVDQAGKGTARILPTPPFMHGAGHWFAFNTWHQGGTVVVQSRVDRLDPSDVLSVASREKASALLMVGDAFGRPILDELLRSSYDLSSLRLFINGGAPMSANLKQSLLEAVPHAMLMDGVGASETGGQGAHFSTAQSAATGRFMQAAENCVLSEDLSGVLAPGHEGLGWWAKLGNIPLGYLDDPEKTAKTFPEVGGVRYSVPGDRARLLADGSVELHGRDSVTINSGGEKIFAEEVELALRHHPAVYDVVVAGRPSERWGEEVVAIVQLRAGESARENELLAECSKHIARFKLPKAFVFRDEIVRSPSGKADYRWAKQMAKSEGSGS